MADCDTRGQVLINAVTGEVKSFQNHLDDYATNQELRIAPATSGGIEFP